MSGKLNELFQRAQMFRAESDASADLMELGNILTQLIEEVQRIDSTAQSANRIAGCLANGIKPD